MGPQGEVSRPAPWSVRRRLTVWVVGSVLGAGVLVLPDSDERVLSLSRTHGPAPVDLLGILLLVAAWLPVAQVLWLHRVDLRGRWAGLVAVVAVAGGLGLVATVVLDLGPVYLVPVTLLVAAQGLALHVVTRPRRGR